MPRVVFVAVWLGTVASLLHGSEPGHPTRELPTIRTAVTDERGRVVVNGSPFFPILMYDVPVDEASLALFHDFGFNTLSARVDDAELLRKHGFYTAAHAAAANGQSLDGVLFGVGTDSPALYWKADLLPKVLDDLTRMRALFPRRPIFHAIGYWEDEPDGVFQNRLPKSERYEDLVKALDVSAPYLYPVPYHPVESVAEALRRANAATDGKKALLPVLQLFVWKPDDRYPTPAELKCMVWLSLIHGADGIGYYSYNYVTGKTGTNVAREHPELWQAVREINREVRDVSPFLLTGDAAAALRVTAPPASIHWKGLSADKADLLLIANTSPERQSVTVESSGGPATLRRVSDGRAFPAVNGTWTLSMEPFAASSFRRGE